MRLYFQVLQVKIPKYIPLMITMVQIMQMIVGVIINVNTYYIKCKFPFGYCYYYPDVVFEKLNGESDFPFL